MENSIRLLLAAFLTLASLLPGWPTLAQENEEAVYYAAIEEGNKAIDVKNWKLCKSAFQTASKTKAFKKEKDPNFLRLVPYNIGFCAEKLENTKTACKYYKQATDKGDKKAAEAYQRLCEKSSTTEDKKVVTVPPIPSLPTDQTTLSWVGWTGIGLFAAGTVGAVTTALLIDGDNETLAVQAEYRDSKDSRYKPKLARDIQSEQNILFAGEIVSFGAIAVGAGLVVWDFMSHDDEKNNKHLTVAPVISSTDVGVGAAINF